MSCVKEKIQCLLRFLRSFVFRLPRLPRLLLPNQSFHPYNLLPGQDLGKCLNDKMYERNEERLPANASNGTSAGMPFSRTTVVASSSVEFRVPTDGSSVSVDVRLGRSVAVSLAAVSSLSVELASLVDLLLRAY